MKGRVRSCRAESDSAAETFAADAAVSAVASAFFIVCDPNRETAIDPVDVEGPFTAAADAAAKVITSASADCESSGNAVGCATARAKAAAWAFATAEAFAGAWAEAYNGCGTCDKGVVTEATASSEALASTFVELTADAFARSEVEVCVQGDQSASAQAMSKCFAKAWTKVSTQAVAHALISGRCDLSKAQVFVDAVTSAEYTTVESCSESTATDGNGEASTDGGSAEAVRVQCFTVQRDCSI